MRAVKETNFKFRSQTGFYRGKVRDVYYFKDTMAMVATDRISAFDVVLPKAIPDKGRVLNQIAASSAANCTAAKRITSQSLLLPITTPTRGFVIGILLPTRSTE